MLISDWSKKVTKIMNKSPDKIKNMFNSIATQYDRLNNLISFGLHKKIKTECVKPLNIKNNEKILDLCTGTGDLAGILQKYSSDITGADFSEEMLKIARQRYKNIEFINANSTNLPFDDESFDVVTMTYGLRNIENRELALKEIYRVLKPNGRFLQLDFGEHNFIGKIFEFVVPVIAKIFAKKYEPYKYLVESKKDFPNPEKLIDEICKIGFILQCRKDFLFKAISCQIFCKIVKKII